MQAKFQHVKKHFDNTECYIDDNLVIGMRGNLIRENLPDLKNMEILDIGCGNGEITLPYLKDNSITFLDISKNMLDLVRKKINNEFISNAEIINEDFQNFCPRKKYDYVFLIGVLAHVESIPETIKKTTEIIKNDGSVVLQYTNSSNIVAVLLRIIGQLKKLFKKEYDYKINYFTDKTINNVLDNYSIMVMKKISYWPALPGFKYVPIVLRTFLYNRVLNGSLLRPLGGERILVVNLSFSE